jgi:uncharacterized membrane protein
VRTTRLEAFSDGVLAIIITITVLELRPPAETTFAALRHELPVFLSYALSFVFLGIYWNNHHHLLAVTERVTGGVLWANLHLLFWLSLIPFATGWVGHQALAKVPTATYGVVPLLAAIAYFILARAILASHGPDSLLAQAIGRDFKGKVSVVIYAAAVAVAFVQPWVAMALYTLVAILWLVPDRRIERAVTEHQDKAA